ncbi:hypothetical protein F2P56_014484 [Juglans regia]|uniref:Uncharacterized protein At5g41620-like n=2 Tax=Juglans regia TaxID=51240 RepID=A0A2I4G2Q8_JUGRE|nr:uncharacterized protein At5g41620-like [Juglans regia]KAF5464407.1 hypothetical protein F2P56_014484 [Juglans regia]
MESKGKSVEREAEKQGLMVKKLKRRMLVGKRGGPSTPPPTWRLEFSSHKNDDATNIREFLTFPNTAASISARKLGANLWEIQPHRNVRLLLAKMSKGGAGLRCRHHRDKGFEISKDVVDPSDSSTDSLTNASHLRRNLAASIVQEHRPVQRSNRALQPVSPASYGSSFEVARYKPAVTPPSSLDLKSRMVESDYGIKTSTELLKVLNRIWSLEEQHTSNISLVKALKMELFHSRARIKELLEEKELGRHGMGDLIKRVAEDKLDRKNKEQDQTKAAIEAIKHKLEDEKKSRKHSEGLHRKLAQELSELKQSFSNALRELQREREARILLENLCDEFAKGIRDYEQKLRPLNHKTEKYGVGRENPDRLILHISEAWLDERMQMKLEEAQNDFAEKSTILDKLGSDIESFLQAKQSNELRTNGNLPPLEPKTMRRHSLESFPLNDTVSAPQKTADEEDFSTVDDSHYFEQNKGTSRKQSKGSSKQKEINASDSHHKERMKSNSIRKQVEMGGEKKNVINYPEKSGMSEATREDLQERHSKRVGIGGLNSDHVPNNLIRNYSLSLEGEKIDPPSNCREDSCVWSVLTSNTSPAQQWMSKLKTPDFEKSESSLRWPRGLKENTLMAKLLEARLETKQSRSKLSKGSFN